MLNGNKTDVDLQDYFNIREIGLQKCAVYELPRTTAVASTWNPLILA